MPTFTPPPNLNGDALVDELASAGYEVGREDVELDGGDLIIYGVGEQDRSAVQAVVDAHVPPDPPPDPDTELASAIEGASNVAELKDALLGNLSQGRVAGRPSN